MTPASTPLVILGEGEKSVRERFFQVLHPGKEGPGESLGKEFLFLQERETDIFILGQISA